MKTSVNAGPATNCPTCARPLPAGAPAGLCPACLLAQGAETESGAGGPRTRFEPPSLAAIAALFPQLELLRLLGAGGMGAVYQARQPALDRFVALKVLPADADGEANFTERFNREARALARLSHPNIVAVHEFGQAGGLHYFLMEFVDGANLRQLEQAGRLSPREALQIIPQICDALQYAHDEGVVHRDIKPENVLVDRKGRVKIADFGLAKILGHDPETARLTVEGQVMGTPHYMAPEQVERPLAVDHRADIYALGVVFYEMLTGDLPLGKFAPPSRKVQVDVRLDEIVLRALENDPERRYQQASEVKQRVATVVESPAEAKVSAPAANDADEDVPKPGVRYLRWLGIPVVTERDGEREVNFQGALAAVFVTMMVAALGHQIARWTAGTEHALARFVWLAGGLTVMWGIRRTLNQPWGDEPPRAANGTVVFAPRSRFRYWRDALMLVGVFVFTTGSHYFKTLVLSRPAGGMMAALARQNAEHDPQTGTFLVRHPAGGTAELLGISALDSATNGWWQADGKPQNRFSLGVRDVDDPMTTNALVRNFLFEFNGLPGDAVERIEFESALSSLGSSGADEVFRDGKPVLTDVRRYLVAFPTNLAKTTIRLVWGAGAWQPALALGGPPWRETPPVGVFTAQWRLKFVGLPAMTGDELQVSYLCGRRDPVWSQRLVAIDRQDRIHLPQSGSGTSAGTGGEQDMVFVSRFRGLEVADVKEFQLQIRPLRAAEFPAVALNPQVPLPRSESGLAFTPPTLLTVDELVDFDVGHAADFPPAAPGENPIAGAAENVAWALEQGFDAVVGIGRLDLLSVRLVPITAADWERMTPAAAEARLAATGTLPRELRPAPDTTPAYAFRTRDGGLGLLRIVEVTGNGQKFVLQLRHAVRPGADRQKLRAKPDAKSHALRVGLPGKGGLELRPVVPTGDSNTSFELLTTAEGQPLRVAKTPWLRGDAFAGASWRMDPVSNTRVIVLRLSNSGRREFARLSAEHVREQVALVLAGRVLFAPQIAAPMDVATLDLSGLDRERGQFVELLTALNPQPAGAGAIRFGEEHEVVVTKSGGGTFHWWNLAEGDSVSVGGLEPLWAKMAANPIPAEARNVSAGGLDRSTRQYQETRRAMGGDLEALGGNPMPVVSGQDLTVVPLAGDGQAPTALEVAYRWELLHQEPEPENLLSTGTYALRTRRGFTGILEVLGWAPDQTGVRIRYREVLNSNATP